MTERIISASKSLIESSPFSTKARGEFEHIGGNIQLNFKYGKGGVLHVSPVYGGLSDTEKLVCNRWFYDDKPLRLTNIHKLAGSLHERVKVPTIQAIGEIPHNGQSYPFWFDTYMEGEELSKIIFRENDLGVYELLMVWLARLHESERDGSESLRAYYEKRLDAFASMLQDLNFRKVIGNGHVDGLNGVVEELRANQLIVDSGETVSLVHGDLHGDNVLVLPTGEVGVMDFEQGVNGGDWFCDIAKLLVPETNVRPDPSRPYKYVPPFGIEIKRKLIARYIEEREQNSWTPPEFITDYVYSGNIEYIKGRNKLYRFDNMMSVLIIRYLSGWQFYTDPETGRRGTSFIIENMKKKYGWK